LHYSYNKYISGKRDLLFEVISIGDNQSIELLDSDNEDCINTHSNKETLQSTCLTSVELYFNSVLYYIIL
jgi:hypothetical protein